jgi:hypothetical protein
MMASRRCSINSPRRWLYLIPKQCLQPLHSSRLNIFHSSAFTTRVEYERNYTLIAEDFSEFRVADVRPTDVSCFIKNHFRGKPTAAHHYKARLSTFFRWAVETGCVTTIPAKS